MSDEKLYTKTEAANAVGISPMTLNAWYRNDNKMKRDNEGYVSKLPQPVRTKLLPRHPKVWTESQVNELRKFKKNMVHGKNGIYGKYNHPKKKEKQV